jgi:hypothetical protein
MGAAGMTWLVVSVFAIRATRARQRQKTARKTYCTLYTRTTHKEVVDGVPEVRIGLGDAQGEEHGFLPRVL